MPGKDTDGQVNTWDSAATWLNVIFKIASFLYTNPNRLDRCGTSRRFQLLFFLWKFMFVPRK